MFPPLLPYDWLIIPLPISNRMEPQCSRIIITAKIDSGVFEVRLDKFHSVHSSKSRQNGTVGTGLPRHLNQSPYPLPPPPSSQHTQREGDRKRERMRERKKTLVIMADPLNGRDKQLTSGMGVPEWSSQFHQFNSSQSPVDWRKEWLNSEKHWSGADCLELVPWCP